METININKQVFDLYDAIKKHKFRHNLDAVHLNSENMIASNGYFMLVSKKLDPELPSNINVKPLTKWLSKILDKVCVPFKKDDRGAHISSCGNITIETDPNYPDINLVTKDLNSCDYTIGLNADYLMSICKYLNRTKGKNHNIYLKIPTSDIAKYREARGPIKVTGLDPDSYGVIMPVRE